LKARVVVLVVLCVVLALVVAVQLWFHRTVPRRLSLAARADVRTVLEDFRPGQGPLDRLRPDGRYLLALAELSRWTGVGPAPEPRADYRGGRWWISLGDAVVDSLSELPEFLELHASLKRRARQVVEEDSVQLRDRGGPDERAELELEAFHGLAAARRVEERWRERPWDPALLGQSLRAMVTLAVQTTDRLEVSDPIAARAWGLLALRQTLGGERDAREECLLAGALGYSSHARLAAQALPGTDPVRAFVLEQDSTLARLAGAAPPPTPRPRGARLRHPAAAPAAPAPSEGVGADARFLWLRRLAQREDLGRWSEALADLARRDTIVAYPAIATGLLLRRFESNESVGTALTAGAIEDLELNGLLKVEPRATPDPDDLEELIERFEKAMEEIGVPGAGAFFDRALARAHYRAHFYSGLDLLGRHQLHSLGSLPGAREFAEQLGEPASGPPADFASWYRHQVEAKDGEGDLRALRADVNGMPGFGMPLRRDAFEALLEMIPDGDPSRRSLGKEFLARLDSRPACRLAAGTVVHRELLSLAYAEQLLTSASGTRGDDVRTRAWSARYRGELGRLEQLAADTALTVQDRAAALVFYGLSDGADSARVRAAFERAIAEWPEDWDLSQAYVDYLERARQYEAARHVAAQWLGRRAGDASSFDFIFAHSAMARMYYHQGLYLRGLQAVAPVVGSWQFGAMNRAARLLERLDSLEEAEKLAKRVVGRYPYLGAGRATAALIQWRKGRFAEAAELLSDPRYPLGQGDWFTEVAAAFHLCFAGRKDEAAKAVDALAARLDDRRLTLAQMGKGIGEKGDHELAFQVLSRLPLDGQERLDVLVMAYRELDRWKGRDQALRWIREQVTDQREQLILGTFGFGQDCPELLWEVGPRDLPRGLFGDYQWLLRAAASLEVDPEQDPNHSALLEHYRRDWNRAHGFYHLTGRYLLGLESDSTALAAARVELKRECELAFFMGAKARAEGRYREAAEHYERCIATGLNRNAEYHWALGQLMVWSSKARTLELIAEDERRAAEKKSARPGA
jgi:tetratricopeptide (TPR) repeat protein